MRISRLNVKHKNLEKKKKKNQCQRQRDNHSCNLIFAHIPNYLNRYRSRAVLVIRNLGGFPALDFA